VLSEHIEPARPLRPKPNKTPHNNSESNFTNASQISQLDLRIQSYPNLDQGTGGFSTSGIAGGGMYGSQASIHSQSSRYNQNILLQGQVNKSFDIKVPSVHASRTSLNQQNPQILNNPASNRNQGQVNMSFDNRVPSVHDSRTSLNQQYPAVSYNPTGNQNVGKGIQNKTYGLPDQMNTSVGSVGKTYPPPPAGSGYKPKGLGGNVNIAQQEDSDSSCEPRPQSMANMTQMDFSKDTEV
jgi:hypothetical protein